MMFATRGIINRDEKFDAATQAVGEPPPSPAGSIETFVVTGLDPDTTHWFAAKDVRWGEYDITARIKNEGTTEVTIKSRVEILDGTGRVVDRLPDKVVTIGGGDRAWLD